MSLASNVNLASGMARTNGGAAGVAQGEQPAHCRYCGAPPMLGSTAMKWRRVDPKPMWFCSRYPACDTYVGCHDGGITAMGSLAGPQLRRLRAIAHKAFDPLWQEGGRVIGRSMAYLIAGRVMGVDDFHIGHLDEEGCLRLIDLIPEIDHALSCHAAQILHPLPDVDAGTCDLLHAVFWCVETSSLGSRVPLAEISRYGELAQVAVASGCVVIEEADSSAQPHALLTTKGRRLISRALGEPRS